MSCIKPIAILTIACCLTWTSSALSQSLDFSVSPRPVGSGARAAGMADAFSAVADDATAASWNPAGLVQLERPEFSIVAESVRVKDRFGDQRSIDERADHTVTADEVNFMSLTYPIPRLIAGRNTVLSLSYQQRFSFDQDYGITTDNSVPQLGINNQTDFSIDQSGSLGTLSPAIAIEITDTLSIGLAVNIWSNSLFGGGGWDREEVIFADSNSGQFGRQTTLATTSEKYDSIDGENFTAGLLWNVSPRWNLSLRYDSGFEADIDYESTTTIRTLQTDVDTTKENRKMRFSDTWGVGAAFRPNDRLTLAMHISRSDWNDFYVEQANGVKFSLVDGVGLDEARATKFDPTHSIRFGAEYVFIPTDIDAQLNYLWTVRGGLIYDEEPASNRSTFNPTSKGNGKPDRYYGFAAGVGLQMFRRVNLDLAYQFRYGDDVKSDRIRGLNGFSEDYRQHRIMLSTIVYF